MEANNGAGIKSEDVVQETAMKVSSKRQQRRTLNVVSRVRYGDKAQRAHDVMI